MSININLRLYMNIQKYLYDTNILWCLNLDYEKSNNIIKFYDILFINKLTGIVEYIIYTNIVIINNAFILNKLIFYAFLNKKLISEYYSECSDISLYEYDWNKEEGINSWICAYIDNIQDIENVILSTNDITLEKIILTMNISSIITNKNLLKGFLTIKSVKDDTIYELWDVCTPIKFRNQKIMSKLFESINILSIYTKKESNILYINFNNKLWDILIKFYTMRGFLNPEIVNTSINNVMYGKEYLLLTKKYPINYDIDFNKAIILSNRFRDIYMKSIQKMYDIYYIPYYLINKLRKYILLDREYSFYLKVSNIFYLHIGDTQSGNYSDLDIVLEISNIILDSFSENCGDINQVSPYITTDYDGESTIVFNNDGKPDKYAIYCHTHPNMAAIYNNIIFLDFSPGDILNYLNIYYNNKIPFYPVINSYGINFIWVTYTFQQFILKYCNINRETFNIPKELIDKIIVDKSNKKDKEFDLCIIKLKNGNNSLYNFIKLIFLFVYYCKATEINNYIGGNIFTKEEIELDNKIKMLVNILHNYNSTEIDKKYVLNEIEIINNIPGLDKFEDNLIEYVKKSNPGNFILFPTKKIQIHKYFENYMNSLTFFECLELYKNNIYQVNDKLGSNELYMYIYECFKKFILDNNIKDFILFHFETKYYKNTSDINKDIFLQVPSFFDIDNGNIKFNNLNNNYDNNMIGKYIPIGEYNLNSLDSLQNIGDDIKIPKDIPYPQCTYWNQSPYTYYDNRVYNTKDYKFLYRDDMTYLESMNLD